MIAETQSGMGLGAVLVRLWLLVYLGVMSFVPLGMLGIALVTEGTPGRNAGPWGPVAILTLIPLYALSHMTALVGVMKKAYWAWTLALIVVTFDLVFHGAVRADLFQKIFLLTCPLFSLILLAIPGVKPNLGSRVRAV